MVILVRWKLNKILLSSMPNGRSKKAYVQVFYYRTGTLKIVNMFERMEIDVCIYKGVLEPSYKKLLGQIPTVLFTADK